MERQFLVVLEHEQPGSEENVVGIIFVRDGQTVWMDSNGDVPYPEIPADEAGFENLQSLVEQGNRRLVVVPAEHFDEIKNVLVGQAQAQAVAMA